MSVRSIRQSQEDNKYILLILVLGIVFRFWGIWYGLPAAYNSTEYFIAKHALSFGARHTIEPLYFIYPTFYIYLITVLYGGYYLLGNIAGYFGGPTDFALQFLLNPTGFYLAGRILNALAVLLAAVILYKTIRFFAEQRIAFFSALLLLTSAGVFEFTFWMVPDAILLLGTVTVFFYVVKNHFQVLSRWELVWVSLICGLTVSTKYNAGFIVLALILSLLLNERENIAVRFRNTAIAVLIIFVGFVLGTPYWIIAFKKFWTGFQMISTQARYAYNVETGIPYVWEIFTLVKQEWLLGVLMTVVLFSLFLKLKRFTLPFAAAVLPTFLLAGSFEKKGWDYLIILYPALLICLAYWVVRLPRQKKYGNLLLALLVIGVIFNGTRILYKDFMHTRQDTRQMTSEWIMKQLPPGSSICYDHYHYDLDLIDIQRFTQSGQGSRLLDDNLKQRLMQLENLPINYRFVPAQKELISPQLDDNRILAEVKGDSFLWQAYTHPHKNLQEITADSAQLLILNSQTYSRFLDNPPPPEWNPLRQNFLDRKGFYRTVFNTLEPVQVFKPSWSHPGPVIQIYKLKDE